MRARQYGKIRIFGERELRDYLETKRTGVLYSIDNETDDYLLTVNEHNYISYKIAEAEVESLQIHDDQMYVSSEERMIPAEHFPRSFNVYSGNSYKKDVFVFHIPFSGDPELLKCMPGSRILWSTDVSITNNEFSFDIINFNDDADEIARQKDSILNNILRQYSNLRQEIDEYNEKLEKQIQNRFEFRKNRIREKLGVLASLGVPIKKSSAPETFSVPTAQKRRKVMLSKPVVTGTGYKPEPSLDESVYSEILRLIHDVGKEFERLPSLYANKEEEHLRDHFLMILEPNFEGTASGETFNKTGKTDILLRHERSNVFIAECKFWTGKKGLLNTITQLLGYLTWRDSKAAVIMFVKNKKFSSVIDVAKSSLSEHSNFLRIVNERDESWFNCEFHLNDDANRVVKVAIMLYHMPTISM